MEREKKKRTNLSKHYQRIFRQCYEYFKGSTIGRIYAVKPAEGELIHRQLLLQHKAGGKCLMIYLLAVNNIVSENLNMCGR